MQRRYETRPDSPGGVWTPLLIGLATLVLFACPRSLESQLPPRAELLPRASWSEGMDISPAFEGWEENEDGSYDIVFGYMNRNWEETPHVPVGPNNYLSLVPPGTLDDLEVSGYDASAADMGQPTLFQPRRNRFTFRARVPGEFATSGEELVWTLTVNGSTIRAYGTLARDYRIDNIVIMSETGALGAGTSDEETRANQPPEIEVEGDHVRTVRVGEPLTLAMMVTDETVPRVRGGGPPDEDATPRELFERALNRPRRGTVSKVTGLHVAWFVYRGDDDHVTFDSPQIKVWEDTRAFANSPWAPFWVPPEAPEDGRWVTQVTFDEPGTYVIRGRADDGGLFSEEEITVEVSGPAL